MSLYQSSVVKKYLAGQAEADIKAAFREIFQALLESSHARGDTEHEGGRIPRWFS